MELPVQSPRKTSYTIETKNLSYRFPPPIKKFNWQYYKNTTLSNTYRYILKNVDLEAKPGEVTAIAGSSGAGKTTLLEVLAGMTSPSRISGQVFVNDSPMDVVNFRRVSGYVTQDDTLFPLLTVEETIMYSARLRLSGGWVEAAARAREVLKELGLDHIAGSRIGNGISGGEKRRISIGVDLVHDPAVLLIDEPTSGLDSASALHVVSLLKEMAKNRGKTIVLTIHQPGFRILELFNRVVLLSEGSVLHHGSLKLLEAKIKAAGHCIPRNVNVLEYALDATESLIIETSSSPDERLSIVDEKFETKDSEECKLEEKKDQEQDLRRIEGPKVQAKHAFYANSQCGEVLILGQRFCKNTIRTKQLFAARIVQSIVAGFGLGTIFMNVKSDAAGRVALQTRLGFFAFSLTFLLSSTTEGLPIYLKERRILMKETSRGAYRVSSYVIANTLIFLPFLLMVALLYTTPVYWLVGLRREIDGFLYFSLVVWMVVLMANSFVACFSALVPNFIMGNSLIAGMMGSFFLFSGYFISKKNIPNYWIFMHYLSLFKYPFESFMINEYGGKKGRNMCVDREGEVCVLYGDGFLRQQGLKDSQKWSNLGVMLGFICGYRLLCYLILWYRCYPRRK